jgi:REP element-mobilizing transposase RayT
MQFYRRNLPHMQRDCTPHFITFCTKFHRTLPDWARDIVLGCCVYDHGRRYRLRVAVVMPDHVHVILTPLISKTRQEVISLVEIMKAIKGASAHAINRDVGNHGTIWQEESFDRVVRSSESLDAKVDYILQNPVRKALVQDWRQYKWIWQPPEENLYAPPKAAEIRRGPTKL